MDDQQYVELLRYKQTRKPTKEQQQKFNIQGKLYSVKQGRLFRLRKNGKELLVIRRSELEAILKALHDSPYGGHLGSTTMEDKVKEKYWWKNFINDIREYVKTCDTCQRKGKPRKNQLLHPVESNEIFEQFGIDAIGPLPMTANGNRFILTAMDYLSKWPIARAVPDITAATTVRFLNEEIISHYGCFKRLISDRGPNFRSELVKEFTTKLGIHHAIISAYHPQANGLVERFNKTLSEMLGKFADEFAANWDEYIPQVLFAYRTTKHRTTKFTPYRLVYGKEAILPIDLQVLPQEIDLTNKDALLDRVLKMIEVSEIREEARQNIKKAQEKYKGRYDETVKEETFEIGDKVLKHIGSYTNRKDVKLRNKWQGPYYIHQVLLNGAYKLRNLEGKVLTTPVNGNNLKRYEERPQWEPIVFIDIPPPF